MALLYDGQPPTAHAEGGKVSAIGPKPSDVRRTRHGHFDRLLRDAACAVLLWRGDPLPKTHASLIGRFGLTVRDFGSEGREAGAALHEAFLRRTRGDYDVDVSFRRSDAIAARERAIKFVDYCRGLLRKRPR
jgi:hypothetical protein